MSTHPSNDNRRDNLRKWLPEARAVYQRAATRYGSGEQLF